MSPLATVFASLAIATSAEAQKQLADDLIVLGAGQNAQAERRAAAAATPGGSYNRLGPDPGGGDPVIRPLPGIEMRVAQQPDVLSAAANPIGGVTPSQPEYLAAPAPVTTVELPAGGPLELPSADEEGPADGLTLDSAVELVTSQSLSLQAKFREIPKATADVLTAGLRGNPLVFGSVDNAPYGEYSQQRPGEVGYGITVIQPFDINQKRVYRVIAAERARDVVHAQYQDAVRIEIDTVYTLYVDALAARETIRYVDASITGLQEVLATVDRLVANAELTSLEQDRVLVQLDAAALTREQAQAAYDKACERLATALSLPAPVGAPLQLRGSIRTEVSQVPGLEQVLDLAMMNRPDLRAFQLGMSRAAAEVDLAVKERYPDVFVLYTPWGLTDNSAIGERNAESWGISGMASVPLFNRNQGNIRRAQLSRQQTSLEWAQLQRQVEGEVRQAYRDFEVAVEKSRRLEMTIIPRVRSIRDKTLEQLRGGRIDLLAYIQTQREYADIVRQFRDALIDVRLAALRINTVTGVRIVY
jgi:cobalt-zinc-cadmium efflux system outer membrane protein